MVEIICFCIFQAHRTTIAKGFRIFPESTMLNNLQSIAQENRYQPLDSPETDPAQYIINHQGIERLSKPYQVAVSYCRTQRPYFRLTRRIEPSIASLTNEVQAHLRSTLLSSVMVSDLTLHAYSIQRPISSCRHSVFTYDSTPGTPLNCVYPLSIKFESGVASTQSVICQTLNV